MVLEGPSLAYGQGVPFTSSYVCPGLPAPQQTWSPTPRLPFPRLPRPQGTHNGLTAYICPCLFVYCLAHCTRNQLPHGRTSVLFLRLNVIACRGCHESSPHSPGLAAGSAAHRRLTAGPSPGQVCSYSQPLAQRDTPSLQLPTSTSVGVQRPGPIIPSQHNAQGPSHPESSRGPPWASLPPLRLLLVPSARSYSLPFHRCCCLELFEGTNLSLESVPWQPWQGGG